MRSVALVGMSTVIVNWGIVIGPMVITVAPSLSIAPSNALTISSTIGFAALTAASAPNRSDMAV